MKKILLLAAISLLGYGCDSDEDDEVFNITATIDGTGYSFECNRSVSNANDYVVSCQNGNTRRLKITKGYNENDGLDGNGILNIEYADVPNAALFDTSYSINYACNDTATINSYDPLCPGNLPTYDAASSTFTATDVVINQTWNRTGEDISWTYVAGEASHTISVTIVLSDVPYFQ